MTKYGAKRTEHAGRVYASKAEARRAVQLQMLEQAGEIRDLEYQPVFDLVVDGVKVGRYVGDFAYVDAGSGARVVEDVKGVRTPVYRLKKKLVKAIHGIDVQEIAA